MYKTRPIENLNRKLSEYFPSNVDAQPIQSDKIVDFITAWVGEKDYPYKWELRESVHRKIYRIEAISYNIVNGYRLGIIFNHNVSSLATPHTKRSIKELILELDDYYTNVVEEMWKKMGL